MRVFVTKYALTTGIIEYEAQECEQPSMICVVPSENPTARAGFTQYFHGRDWHLDADSARERAEEMRVAKIASLERNIKKLRAKKF